MDLNKPNYHNDLPTRYKIHGIWTYLYFPVDDSDKRVSLVNMSYKNDHTCPEDLIAEHNGAVEFIISGVMP